MKVLVTGGAGFIGSAVVRELERRNIEPVIYDRRVPVGAGITGDIRDAMRVQLALSRVDGVIHLAGVLGTSELFDNVELAIDVNIRGTANVLEAARHFGTHYVGVSMLDVFPSVYTATKICGLRLASAFHRAYQLPVSHVRAFNAYGPGQKYGPGHPQKILPTFATCAWARRPIPVWGDGYQTVDLVHTNDLARLFVDALSHGDDALFDGGTGVAFTVNEVAAMVNAIAESPAGTEHLPMRIGEDPTNVVAQGAGWDRLTWKPEFRATEFAEAVESYRDISHYTYLGTS